MNELQPNERKLLAKVKETDYAHYETVQRAIIGNYIASWIVLQCRSREPGTIRDGILKSVEDLRKIVRDTLNQFYVLYEITYEPAVEGVDKALQEAQRKKKQKKQAKQKQAEKTQTTKKNPKKKPTKKPEKKAQAQKQKTLPEMVNNRKRSRPNTGKYPFPLYSPLSTFPSFPSFVIH